jgi:putative ABC transport system substrate-binding protein
MRRRTFIMLLGSTAAWPLAAQGQQAGKSVRIGYLSATSPPDPYMEIFRQGMADVGYVEGHHFVVEARFAHRDYRRVHLIQ